MRRPRSLAPIPSTLYNRRMSRTRAHAIRRMFDAISPRYDLLNHLLSAGIDRGWRTVAAKRLRASFAEAPPSAGPRRVLDVCTGTGDLAFAVLDTPAHAPAGPPVSRDLQVVGVDFSRPMLRRAHEKSRRRGTNGALRLQATDALRLPFRDGAFDACTIAFGLRNLVDTAAGLREMARVLRPGGRLFVLEFGNPRIPGIRQAYGFYFNHLLPVVGRAVSRSHDAYDYLPRTVSEFPDRERLSAMMTDAGLEAVAFRPLTFGIAILYEGRKPLCS
jgi:demethylmenaquinone methyltransferase/2-methoxy-6-polyprenyl-1,4-benzoquinol methylase